MKAIKQISFFVLFISHVCFYGQSSFFQKVDKFLYENVRNGFVNYSNIENKNEALNQLVKDIEKYSLNDLDKNERLAFYINAYNILVIKQIINHLPLESPLDYSQFFDDKFFLLEGEQRSLNELENTIIRPQFNDARIHFVLVCGAVGCPPIIPNAYFPNTVQEQLSERTTAALDHPLFTRVKASEVELSEIFKWYASDFGSSTHSIIQFINQYKSNKISENSTLSYYPYDWKINKQK